MNVKRYPLELLCFKSINPIFLTSLPRLGHVFFWVTVVLLFEFAVVGVKSTDSKIHFRQQLHFGSIQQGPSESICETLINSFSDASTNYTRCIIQHAISYQRCQACVYEFLRVGEIYRLLLQKQNNSFCLEVGEVSVFKNVHNFVKKSWEDGGCQSCFAWYNINSTASAELSDNSKKFLALTEQFYQCIFNDSYLNNAKVGVATLWLFADRNYANETTCVRCKREYEALNRFYVAKFETVYDKDTKICVDISDMMNFSRYIWQEVYQCPMLHASTWPIVVASVILCSLPVAFYIASKIFGHDIKPNVIHPKRYRGSLAPRNSSGSVDNHVSSILPSSSAYHSI